MGGEPGWLMPKYGMAMQNLLADVIIATGKVLRASPDSDPDVFWAIRGGGTFGVVTDFLFQLHAVGKMVYGGLAAHPFEKALDRIVRTGVAEEHQDMATVLTRYHQMEL